MLALATCLWNCLMEETVSAESVCEMGPPVLLCMLVGVLDVPWLRGADDFVILLIVIETDW
jgi:hypothetical protein